jgi:pimeloyl-ACP methyl ester carboxylesterase
MKGSQTLSESFDYEGHRVAYRSWGSGERTLILIHGLLLNSGMFARLAPELAARGNRVVCIDLLGHGESDGPEDFSVYSMTAFADQVAALIDHLGVERAVVGGTSLGANVSLELAAARPDRVRALFIEMPVLDNALLAVALTFTPIMFASTFGAPLLRVVAGVTRRIPRSHHLVDIGVDWLRRDPTTSACVLQGLLLGRTCPPSSERRQITAPTLVVGHRADPIHPFSDSGELVSELPGGELVNAHTILEWRLYPSRLDDALAGFLDRVHASEDEVVAAA